MNNKTYDIINNKILELLEGGIIPWVKGWNSSTSMPKNLVSKKEYKGVNVFLLACNEFSSPWYLTYNQCATLGGHVLKGSKSTPVIFWKMFDKSTKDQDEDTTSNGKSFILKYYSVFNLEQTEGITAIPPTTEVINPFSPIEQAEQIIEGMPLKPEIKYGGGRAYYSPSLDYCQIPSKTAFNSPEEYYSTMFHELAHSSGHANRLGRKTILEPSYFGSHEYSKEELVAECCSAFISGHCGIEHKTLENSAAYIQGWLKALKNDKTLLVHAASQGQKAADYILNIKPEEQEESE